MHGAKIALTGGPGAGKDTFTRIAKKLHPALSIQVVRLAEPLYEAQRYIYQLCSRGIEPDAQDGVLLNFLGKHMRAINPRVLLDRLAHTLEKTQADLILCSDARPIDLPFVQQMGFTIVHIATDPALALDRRKKRGDLSLSNSAHETETGASPWDIQISNNGTLEEFEASIASFLQEHLIQGAR